MEEMNREKIEEIMEGYQCPKGFKCAHSGFEELCKAKDIGLENHLECLVEPPRTCPFAVNFGYGHFCKCPLRIYLTKDHKM